ncbi:MAG TPA: hypothetical protein VFW23_14695 [Tepidisphaeraceae bacterium]|nr:hypothetical protein [Tepidisphaeraceae bacterium]
MTGAVLWAILVLIAAIVLCALLFHFQNWLEKTTPVGAWKAKTEAEEITLIFEGGPHEGLYKQLIESSDSRIREFGHWSQKKRSLYLLILASDIPRNPRVGVNTRYKFLVLTQGRISINGPERRHVRFKKAPPDTTLDFGTIPEQR